MGNIEAHDFAPVRPDERKELNLSRRPTFKQYLKHLNGDVQETCLRELPYSIRDSISLYEIMKVAFNALTELPPELPLRLPHLRYLDLSHNHLQELPRSFGLLFHLQTLLVQHNRLHVLPDTFIHLVKLEKVDLSHNVLKELPEDMGKMENLQRLNLSHNKLKQLPLSLGNTSKLTLLLVYKNRLDSPPQSVCDEGSASTLQYLRKQFMAYQDQHPPKPILLLNEFPRNRSNQLHSPVTNPHSAHMQYIQEQTHTTNTPSRIKTPLMPPLGASSYDALELRDKIVGLIYGAAIGDIVGLATRWLSADECMFYYGNDTFDFSDIVHDKYRILWRQWDWTSNFDIFMLVLDSLINWAGVVDELDFAKRLVAWSEHGFLELGDTSGILISSTIAQVVAQQKFTSSPHSVASTVLRGSKATENGDVSNYAELDNVKSPSSLMSTASDSGPLRVQEASSCSEFGTDNGAIIRAAVLGFEELCRLGATTTGHRAVNCSIHCYANAFVMLSGLSVECNGIPSFHDLDEVEENSVRICQATHADPRCVASCVFISVLVGTMLQGKRSSEDTDIAHWQNMLELAKERALPYLPDLHQKEQFLNCLQMQSFSQLKARETGEMSHTYKPMTAAVLALQWDGTFRDFLMQLCMEGGDSNSNCCVGGTILGLRTGYKQLPTTWIQSLRTKQLAWLNLRINHLLDMMGLP